MMNGEMTREFMSSFITLLVAIDPVGTVPFLASATHHLKESERRHLVRRGILIAGAVLLGFAVFGNLLLHSLGVSFSSFRIAGGIILFLVGLQMVFGEHAAHSHEAKEDSPGRDLAIFPIALPYIAGPGSMLAVMVQMRSRPGFLSSLALTSAALVAVLLITGATLYSTSKLNRVLGRTGGEVIGRVMGILLAALAAESVIRGVLEALGRHLD